jgi:hypothetical protein
MPNIDIKIKPSKIFILLIIITLACCLAVIYHLPISQLWIRGIVVALTLRYGWRILKDYGLLTGGYSISHLSLEEDGWKLQNRLRSFSAGLCGESTITNFVCVLRFKAPDRKQKITCIIFCDALPKSSYRQLLVQLRTSRAYEAERARARR